MLNVFYHNKKKGIVQARLFCDQKEKRWERVEKKRIRSRRHVEGSRMHGLLRNPKI